MVWEFKDWYSKNKEDLSVKRRTRYQTDPDYRQAIINRSAARRKACKVVDKPGISPTQVCEVLGISSWTLNRWRNEKYFPVDTLRSYRFTQAQVNLLGLFCEFFEKYPKRASAAQQDKLSALVLTVHHNWN